MTLDIASANRANDIRKNIYMHLDILSFWGANQLRYPELSRMACSTLSIPMSNNGLGVGLQFWGKGA